MRSITSVCLLLLSSTALAEPLPTPERDLTSPDALQSPTNAAAQPVPLEDLVFTRNVGSVAWSADGEEIFLVTNLTGRMNIWRFDVAGSWPVQLTRSDDVQSNLVVSPDGKTLYFAQDKGGDEFHDIYAVPTDGGAVTNLTNSPDMREIGAIMAPDGRSLALSTKRKADAQVNLAVLDLESRKMRWLTDEKDPQRRWNAVAWVDNGRTLIANKSNADQTESEIWSVDVASGKATRIAGKPKTRFIAADASEDGRTIAASANDGSSQLRAGLLDVPSGKWRWLTPTPWQQTAEQLSPDGKTMIVRTGIDGRSVLTAVAVDTGKERSFDFGNGVASLAGGEPFAGDSRRLLLQRSGADTPADLFVLDVNSGTTEQITRMAMASLDPASLPKSQIVVFKSFDETLISAIVTMPFNLHRNGRNPAIIMPHGGPTGQSQDGFNRTAAALASRGYIVLQPNVRGSTGYGSEFQTANFQDLGGGDLKDVLAAKDFLVRTGYVDPDKVGITGGSYGGFMTLMAVAKAPEAFAAGVQLFGIINWYTMYENADPLLKEYIVSLLGDPASYPAVYDATSPMTYMAATKAPLLSLQGDNDIRVPRGQAEEVEAVLKANGVTSETVFYPAEGHGFQKRENQIDSLQRTINWFERHLKGTTPDAPQ
ncbi:MAG: dipeptidyl aminopeptidase/acylaminoacyl-peptidase family protein [Porphyrobacter sp. HL-46]|nr:MAG: dipeptidyl aminopeptidase/acylaminoacyl-peptidase family protein [Porphyrobacter sp. HL-46]